MRATSYARRTEQPAEFAPVHLPAFTPQKHQQRTVQAEDGARCAAGYGKVALHHQGQQVTDDAAGQVQRKKPRAAVQAFHQSAEVPQGPHIERQVHDAEVQEHGRGQAPPLAILRGGTEIGAPGELHPIRRMPPASAMPEHDGKDQDVACHQPQRDGCTPGAVVHQVAQARSAIRPRTSCAFVVNHASLYYSP